MRQTIIVFIALLSIMATNPAVYAAGVELAIGGWQQIPTGDLGYKSESSDDQLNFKDDLGYETENRFMGRLKIDLPSVMPNIYLVVAPMEFEGSGRKSVDFRFGDEVFNADARIDSKLTLNQYDLAIFWGIPGIRTASAGKFNIDLGINARFVDFAADISGESADIPGETISESESLTLVIPMLYVAFQIMPTEKLAVEAEGRGVAISGNSLFSVTGRLRYQFLGPAFIAGGYRLDSLNIDEQDVSADVSFSGPFVELGIKF